MSVWTRIKMAFAAFFSLLFKGRLPTALQPVTAAAPPAQAQTITADTSDRAVQMLALLQREGRFIDFALEDLATYSDAQIGAAARDVHAGCRRVLERYVTLEAILPGREGEAVTLGQNEPIDPAAFHLVGNVAGQPPFRGTLLHPGWRASRVQLPSLATTGRTIVAPAEIELA
ncbi:MAG TPA: DUF2760 domain-containing protein [Vicinamibacterales bacterium]